jgi:hypothetical protein
MDRSEGQRGRGTEEKGKKRKAVQRNGGTEGQRNRGTKGQMDRTE